MEHMFTGKVSPKGQVVIPKEIRQILDLSPGSEVSFKLHDNQIVIKKITL